MPNEDITRAFCPECGKEADIGDANWLFGHTPQRCVRARDCRWIWCVTHEIIKYRVGEKHPRPPFYADEESTPTPRTLRNAEEELAISEKGKKR